MTNEKRFNGMGSKYFKCIGIYNFIDEYKERMYRFWNNNFISRYDRNFIFNSNNKSSGEKY